MRRSEKTRPHTVLLPSAPYSQQTSPLICDQQSCLRSLCFRTLIDTTHITETYNTSLIMFVWFLFVWDFIFSLLSTVGSQSEDIVSETLNCSYPERGVTVPEAATDCVWMYAMLSLLVNFKLWSHLFTSLIREEEQRWSWNGGQRWDVDELQHQQPI